MTDADDPDAPPGFMRATAESLAQWREEALAAAEDRVRRILLDEFRMTEDEARPHLAMLARQIAAYYDTASEPFRRKVLGLPLH